MIEANNIFLSTTIVHEIFEYIHMDFHVIIHKEGISTRTILSLPLSLY